MTTMQPLVLVPTPADPERIEAEVWARFLSAHTNPVLRDAACHLIIWYELEMPEPGCGVDSGSLRLSADQVAETHDWREYFAEHSHPGLAEAAEWFDQWHPEVFEGK